VLPGDDAVSSRSRPFIVNCYMRMPSGDLRTASIGAAALAAADTVRARPTKAA
jgi:hypothetical protein